LIYGISSCPGSVKEKSEVKKENKYILNMPKMCVLIQTSLRRIIRIKQTIKNTIGVF